MTDREQPRYGEYATPEEQAMAISVPAPGYDHPPAGQERAAMTRPAFARPSFGAASFGGATAARSRTWDVLLSVALLAYGFANVVSGFFQFSNLSALLSQLYAAQGIGKFTPTALAGALGIVINLSSAVLWLVTVLITVRLLRRRRLAFYVPILGGVLATIVTAVCIAVLSFSDPAFLSFMASHGG